MAKSESADYLPVDREETPWFEEYHSRKHSNSQNTTILQILKLSCIAITILLIGIAIGYNTQRLHSRPLGPESDFEIFAGTHFESHPRRYNGSFFHRSMYGGKPSPQVDAEWARYAETGSELMPLFPAFLNISRADFERSTGHTADTGVQFEEPNQGYMASLEMLHQVHCLDMIRKFIHFDYYADVDPEWAEAPLLREHAGHCVDMLRDVLMCSADTGLITYHWIKGYSSPMPDFSTKHSCRDPEEVLKWTLDREVKLEKPVLKKKGVAELPEIF